MARREYEEGTMTLPNGSWLGLLRTILTTSGPVALLATLLCAFVMWVVYEGGNKRFDRLDASNAGLHAQMTEATQSMSAFASRATSNDTLRDALLAKQIALLRQVCVNSAKTDYQTRACLQE
jgi:hypothetical protein